jgi:hypothetical protein
VKGGGVFNRITFDNPTVYNEGDVVKSEKQHVTRYLGKVVRWYYGTNDTGTINYKTSGNKVPRTDGCVPLMDLPVDFPNNVNYNFYINEVNDLLMDIGLVARPPVVRKTRAKKVS